jgi:hypothetical protein
LRGYAAVCRFRGENDVILRRDLFEDKFTWLVQSVYSRFLAFSARSGIDREHARRVEGGLSSILLKPLDFRLDSLGANFSPGIRLVTTLSSGESHTAHTDKCTRIQRPAFVPKVLTRAIRALVPIGGQLLISFCRSARRVVGRQAWSDRWPSEAIEPARNVSELMGLRRHGRSRRACILKQELRSDRDAARALD